MLWFSFGLHAYRYVSLLGKKLPEDGMREGSLETKPGMGILFMGVIEGMLPEKPWETGKDAGQVEAKQR